MLIYKDFKVNIVTVDAIVMPRSGVMPIESSGRCALQTGPRKRTQKAGDTVPDVCHQSE